MKMNSIYISLRILDLKLYYHGLPNYHKRFIDTAIVEVESCLARAELGAAGGK